MGEPNTNTAPSEQPATGDVASTELLEKLQQVADIAALCTIDIDGNLTETYNEYMRGEIPHGAYRHVLSRHGSLHAALYRAGYTEKHKLYGFPVRPS